MLAIWLVTPGKMGCCFAHIYIYVCMYILTTWECKLIPVTYVCLTAQFWHLFLLLLLSRAAYANHFRRFQGTPKRIETFNLFASLWLLVPILQGLRFELNIPTWMLFELNTSPRLSQGYSHRSLSKLDDGWPESVDEQSLLLLVWRH